MELEVEEVMETAANIPVPMEEEREEGLWLEEILEQSIPLFLRDGMQDLIE